MKTYKQFILEYRGSRAAEKAYRLGLTSDKHGNWLDRAGNIIARTVRGDLEMIRKKSPSPEKAEPPPVPRKQAEPPQVELPPPVEPLPIQKTPKQEIPPEQEQPKVLTVVFGRFNPPTTGHQKLIQQAAEIASGSDLKIYPSRAQDSTKNPLNADQKIKYMRKMFPEYKDNIINDEEMRTIFDVLIRAQEDGYDDVNIVVGADRVSEFDRLSAQYNGKLYNFNELKVIPTRNRDPDSLTIEAESASKMRKAALEDDFATFKSGMPKVLKPEVIRALYFAVQRVLQQGAAPAEITQGQESGRILETWKYAPKLDPSGLREEYYKGNIFNVGDVVENLNTGLIGTIKRRGPNYLICVTEDDIMFKSWTKDLTEWTGYPKSKFTNHRNKKNLKEAKILLKLLRKSFNSK